MKRAIAALLCMILVMTAQICVADEYYVLCKPGSEVNVRDFPNMKSPVFGCCFFGDKVETDGKERNGFVHIINLQMEATHGWIYKGLLVKDEPVASEGKAQVFNAGRVACRKYVNGKIKRWAYDGDEVEVYAISQEWCVTNYGYIRTEFLTLNAKVR